MQSSSHRRHAGRLIASVSLLCPAMSAWGQQADHPLLLPKSDVAVTYRVDKGPTGADAPRKLQLTYSDAGERVRVDYFRWVEAKAPYLMRIFDRPADRLIAIYPERKAYTDRAIGDDGNPGVFFRNNSNFTRLGDRVIANAHCTEWGVQVPKGESGDTACVTDDGIALQVAQANPAFASLTATTIHYGSPPEGFFDPPAAYRRETSP
jgi:hypothetical protein